MRQVLNIFRKDTRQYWLEIALSVVIAIAFVLMYPSQWKVTHDQNADQHVLWFTALLMLLLITSWWLLIARVILAESLVGDRQFWLTRPYEWKSLLAAKATFLAVWIGVPYLVTQAYLLAEAGFHPLSYVPGLLYGLRCVFLVFVLPVFCVAAVTSNFGRLVLAMLGCFVLFTGFMFLAFGLPHGYMTFTPYPNALLYPLLFAGCAVALTVQYATRRTWLTRGLLMGLSVLLALTVFVYRMQSLVDRAYPQPSAGSAAPLIIRSIPTAAHPVEARFWDKEDYIDLPVKYSGVADGTAVFGDDMKFTITATDGSRWSSPWQAIQERILSGSQYAEVHLMVSPEIYDRFKQRPVTLQVTFAVRRYQSDTVTRVPFPMHETAIAGLGICAWKYEGPAILNCRAALHETALMHVAVQWSTANCTELRTLANTIAETDDWIEPYGPEFSLVSVWDRSMMFGYGAGDARGRVCEGNPMTVTQYHLVNRTQSDMTLTNIQLPVEVHPT